MSEGESNRCIKTPEMPSNAMKFILSMIATDISGESLQTAHEKVIINE